MFFATLSVLEQCWRNNSQISIVRKRLEKYIHLMYFALAFPSSVVCSTLQTEIWNDISVKRVSASSNFRFDLLVDYADKFSYFDHLFAVQILFVFSLDL